MRNIGRRIKITRKQKQLTQLQLAQLIGVDRSHIAKIESGYTRGSITVLKKLAAALDLPLVELLK